MKKIIFLLILFCTEKRLIATFKTNLTGTSYNKVAHERNTDIAEKKPFVSVYGELRASNPIDLISLYFQYNIPTDKVTVTQTGGGTVTQGNGLMTLTALNNNDVARTETKAAINYIPGHEINGFFTAAFLHGGYANTYQYIGIFNTQDGFAIGYNGTNYGIMYRYNEADTFINQSDFNVDKLDGTGPSNFIIDPSKINIYFISFGWLGVASIEFHVIREDGLWVLFHQIQTVNNRETPTVLNPSLPIRAETVNEGGGNNPIAIATASWMGGISGGALIPNREWSYIYPTEITINSTIKPLLLRSKSLFNGKTSTARSRLLYISVAGRNSGTTFSIKIYKNPTLNVAGTFTNIDTNFSVVEYSTNTTITANGTLVFAASGYGQGNNNIFFIPNNIFINFYPSETILIELSEYGSGNVNATLSLGWEEYY